MCKRWEGVSKVARLAKHGRITGAARENIASDMVEKYKNGTSVRALAESIGRSYGFVHRVLVESGVTLRARGATRG